MTKQRLSNAAAWRAATRRLTRAPVGHLKRLHEKLRAPFPHELAMCAIFREEAPFLDEWLTFHAGIGVSRFYLYNNFSTDDFRDVLQPWISRGLVTVVDWPVPVGQLSAYEHCLKKARAECQWVAFIDIDEFLFSPQTLDIRGILRQHADLPGVEVWQVFFGSGGHESRPNVPVTEAYLKRAPLSQTSAKTIANPRLVRVAGVHRPKYWLGEALDTSRRRVETGRVPALDALRINHYWSRSIEDLRTKIARNDASTPVPRDPAWHFEFEKTLNSEHDDSIVVTARQISRLAGAVPAPGDASADAARLR